MSFQSQNVYDRYFSESGIWKMQVRSAINNSIKKNLPELLWHYCPPSAMEGILQSRSFFMSSLSAMNDHKEGKWLRERIIERVSSTSPEFLPRLEATRPKFLLDPFILSLSENGDLLSQWRAYAAGGKGVTLGLNSSQLKVPLLHIERDQMNGYLSIVNVIYEEAVQDLIVDKVAGVISTLVSDFKEFNDDQNAMSQLTQCAEYINIFIHYIEPLFKNPAFREECEWRIVYFPEVSLSDAWKEDICEISLGKDDSFGELKYRFRDDNIIQYFSFPNSGDIISMIDRVLLGPTCRIEKIPLILFLKNRGIYYCLIEHSKATLR